MNILNNEFLYRFQINDIGIILVKLAMDNDDSKKQFKFFNGIASYKIIDELKKFKTLLQAQPYLESLFTNYNDTSY
jgi:hypothetical protein